MVWRFAWRHGLSLVLLGAPIAVGCASTQSLLARRFSKEHSCQTDAVMVREIGGNVYVAEGCGHRIEYVCQSFAGSPGSERNCAERGVNPNAAPQGPPKPVYTNVQEPPR